LEFAESELLTVSVANFYVQIKLLDSNLFDVPLPLSMVLASPEIDFPQFAKNNEKLVQIYLS